MSVEVLPLDDRLSDATDAFLLTQREALAAHSLSYRRLLQAVLECDATYWLAMEEGRVTGMLPLTSHDGPFGRVLNSLPFFGSVGGVLASTRAASTALWRRFDQLASMSDVAAATVICNPLIDQPTPPVDHDFVEERIGQVTWLPAADDAAEAVLALIDGSTRRNIRKAQKSGVSVLVENSAVDSLERIHRENMEEIGGRQKSGKFFMELPINLKVNSEYRIYTARIDNEIVSALLLLYFNDSVEYFMPATLSEFRNSQPMALAIYQAMLDAAARGIACWNWGGTWLSQEGVYRFKKKWGAEDQRYRYYVRVNDKSLLSRSRAELLNAYPDVYVVPFDRLKAA